jgi:hypothetical protein
MIREHTTAVLETAYLRVTVDTARGADVVGFVHAATGIDLAPTWPSEEYRGGWQDVLPNGGPPSEWEGARYGQHGEASELPWDAEVTPGDRGGVVAVLRTALTQTPLRVERRMALAADAASMRVDELVVNDGPATQRAMWGQHLAFGPPFAGPGDVVEIAEGARVVPHPGDLPGGRRVAAPDGRSVDLSELPPAGAPTEMLYLTELREGRYALRTAHGIRLVVEWDVGRLPWLWLWQEAGATRDHPWNGEAWFVGIEPFSSYPSAGLPAAVANGTALTLPPESSARIWWTASVEAA